MWWNMCIYNFFLNVYKNQQSRQTGSRNSIGSKTLPTIWGTYMKIVTKYQISAINSCWEKCDEKCAYMFNVYKNQLSRQTGSRNLMGVGISSQFILLYPRSPNMEGGILFYLCPSVQDIFRRIFLSICWWQKSDIWSQASYRYTIFWVAFLDPSDSYVLFADLVGLIKYQISVINRYWEKCDEKYLGQTDGQR
jgi:hypothetical protein